MFVYICILVQYIVCMRTCSGGGCNNTTVENTVCAVSAKCFHVLCQDYYYWNIVVYYALLGSMLRCSQVGLEVVDDHEHLP